MDRVYVGNLPPDIRIKDIDDFFRPFGKLVYIDVNHRANPVYALVQFDSPRNAFMAVKSRHGYNYEGYTLQLRMAENEVRKRREATPPPPPPSMFSNYNSSQSNRGGFGNDNFNNNRMGQSFSNSSASSSFQSSQWGSFDNYNNNNRSSMTQYTSNNRMNMGQQSMDYSSNNRISQSNMPYSLSGRSNMSQQNMMDYSSNNRISQSNMPYSSSSGRSNMSQQNINFANAPPTNLMNFSNTNQSNMMNYSNVNQSNMNYSNTNQPNMMNFSNTTQSNMMNYSNNNNWGNKDFGEGSYGGGNNFAYNASKDPYANTSFEDSYTRGLSGAGRKWFNRYIREGYSAERAREKALERRTVPYMRDDPKAKRAANDPTNAALENIGTTIMSLLSNTAVDNFNSGNQMMPPYANWGGDNYQAGGNFDMPGPSRGRGEQPNAVSKQQYLKSLNTLKRLQEVGCRSAEDRLSKKYHKQIVSDYERYQKLSGSERDKPNVTSLSSDEKSYTQLLVAFKKKKQNLLVAARKLGKGEGSRQSGAFRKKMRILLTEGDFPEIEARALAVHSLRTLKVLMSMKEDCETALKKKQEKFTPLKRAANEKTISYRNDINYLQIYEKYRVENLSSRVKTALRACIDRIHKHERERKLPLTKSKLTRSLYSNKTDSEKPRPSRRRRGRRRNTASKRDGGKKDTQKQGDEKDKANATKENAADENEKGENHEADANEEHEADGNEQHQADANEEQEADANEEDQECEDNENITEEQQGEDSQDADNVEQDE